MRIQIYARDYAVTAVLRDYITRKLGFGVGRFAGRIAHVSISLKDTNGPRGGVDQHCRVDVAMNTTSKVAAEATELDIYKAIKVAVARVSRRVRTKIDRKRVTRNRGVRASSVNDLQPDSGTKVGPGLPGQDHIDDESPRLL